MRVEDVLEKIFKESAKRERYTDLLAKSNSLLAESIVKTIKREYDFNDKYGIRYALGAPDPEYGYFVQFIDAKNHTNDFIVFLPRPKEHRALIDFLSTLGKQIYIANRGDHIELANNWREIVANAGALLTAEVQNLRQLGLKLAKQFEPPIRLLKKTERGHILLPITPIEICHAKDPHGVCVCEHFNSDNGACLATPSEIKALNKDWNLAHVKETPADIEKAEIWKRIQEIQDIQRNNHPTIDIFELTTEESNALDAEKDALYNKVMCSLDTPDENCNCAYFNKEMGRCDATPSQIEKVNEKAKNIKCLQESELQMCGECDCYNTVTGECDATPAQIHQINEKIGDRRDDKAIMEGKEDATSPQEKKDWNRITEIRNIQRGKHPTIDITKLSPEASADLEDEKITLYQKVGFVANGDDPDDYD